MDLLSLIQSLQPWHWLCLGLVLVALDAFALASFFLMWFGCGVAVNSVWDAMGAGPELQVLLIILATVLSTIMARRFFNPAGSARAGTAPPAEAMVGAKGSVLSVSEDDPSTGRGAVVSQGEWRIESESGSLRVGQSFSVTGATGLALRIRVTATPDPETEQSGTT